MNKVAHHPPADKMISPVRRLAEQALSRTAGAPLVPGNAIKLLKDAKENYPAWLEAMRSAKKSIHFESFIIHQDDIGEQFSQGLAGGLWEDVTQILGAAQEGRGGSPLLQSVPVRQPIQLAQS
jgi:phosphatidylserine/phosphatidylglycerophosphate/cardiolipin synthase-like enzyme